jgi:cell division protein FtsL
MFCDTLAHMSASDDKIIMRKTILALQSQIADLDVEIEEEGSENSNTLQKVEAILQDAVKHLEDEFAKLG